MTYDTGHAIVETKQPALSWPSAILIGAIRIRYRTGVSAHRCRSTVHYVASEAALKMAWGGQVVPMTESTVFMVFISN